MIAQNQLREMLMNPDSFQGTPGFKFARDQGLEAARRQLAARGMGDSGAALAELTKLGTGYAMQDYGNQLDRLGRLDAQDKNFALGSYTATNQADLGNRSLDFQKQKGAWDYELGGRAADLNDLRAEDEYEAGQQRANTDWFNANTNRANARTNMGNALRGFMRK